MGTKESKAKWHNKAKDALYNYQPKLDQDMRASLKNLDDSETNLGHRWTIEDVGVEADLRLGSDPICSSAGCTQY